MSTVQDAALDLLEAQGMSRISRIALNEDFFFGGASCGTCVMYRSVHLSLSQYLPMPDAVKS